MIIKIQSKQAKAEARSGAGERYEFSDPESSVRTPLAIAAFFTALLAYFKSIMGSQAAAHATPGDPRTTPHEDAAIAPERIANTELSPAEEQMKPPEKADPIEVEDPIRRMGAPGRIFSDLLNDERLPDFDRIAALHARRQAEAQTFSSVAKNDNTPSIAANAAPARRGEDVGPSENGGRAGAPAVAGSPSGNGAGGGSTPAAHAGSDLDGNRAPRVAGPVRLPAVVQSHSLFIPLALLLSGAIDADQDALSVRDLQVSSGALKEAPGGWLFTPAGGHLGSVTFTYGVSDGTEAASQTAQLDVVRTPMILGGDGDDLLVGTDEGDEADGGMGSDDIDARGGADLIRGGGGEDHIVAGQGSDIVYAGLGNDVVYGGEGNDILYGGMGDDRLFGEAGDDILYGEGGNDVALGGPGSDQLFGGAGDDLLHGDDGRDYADGGDGDDRIFGDAGDDVLADGKGADLVSGGAGDDVVLAATDAANDVLRGDAGFDTLSYADATAALIIDLGADQAASAEVGADSVSGFEAVVAGAGDDVLTAGAAAVQIAAGAGADVVTGGVGDDQLFGQDGDDRLADGGGADLVAGGAGDDVVFAALDAANDRFVGDAGFDTLSYADATAGIAFDTVAGKVLSDEAGTDEIAGFEMLIGGKGDDTFLIGVAPLIVHGGEGDDTFTFVDMVADLGEREAARLVHEIDDLDVGDRIVYKSFQIQRLAGTEESRSGATGDSSGSGPEDQFAAAFNPDPVSVRPFRFRNETVNQQDHTFIDVIGDPAVDDVQFTIDVLGHARFEYREHA